MTVTDILKMALANLTRRPGRSLLTMVGVVVGTGALVLMVSLGVGLQRGIESLLGGDTGLRRILVTRPLATATQKARSRPFSFGGAGIPGMLMNSKDVQDLRNIEGVAYVSPELFIRATAEFSGFPGEPATDVILGGIVPEQEAELRDAVQKGAMWSAPDEKSCIISSRFAEGRFKNEGDSLIGQTVVFSHRFWPTDDPLPPPADTTFKVIGIFSVDRVGLGASAVYFPSQVAEALRQTLRGGEPTGMLTLKPGTYMTCNVGVKNMKDVEAVKKRIVAAGFEALSGKDMLEVVDKVFLFIEGFLACIGAIGLIVAFFGIANTMAMAVLERTREIGILKAIGGRARDIRRLFLVEAAGIGIVGGLAGLAAGMAGGFLLNFFAHKVWELPEGLRLFYVSVPLAASAVGFAVFVSAVAGFFPARRAAGLDPVGALRYE